MRKICKAVGRMLVILTLLTVVFCGLLFLAGLGGKPVQALVQQNLAESIPQFEQEGSYPRPLYQNSPFYKLDNFTETTILQEAFFMDTAHNPKSILENPRVKLKNVPAESDEKIASFIAAVNGEQSNTSYSYYWMGFRSIVRPLLVLMNYQNIRLLLSLGFYLLLAGSCFTLYRHVNLAVAAAFLLAILGINIAIVSIELQYASCFYLMFLAMILLPHMKKTRLPYPEFFLIIGACTQFFDFYTTPVITLGAPLLFMLASRDLLKETDHRWKVFLNCTLYWLVGYGATWLIRLALVSVTMQENVFATALDKMSVWTGIAQDSRYADGSVLGAMRSNLMGILNVPNAMMYFASAVAIVVLLIKRCQQRRLQRPQFVYLLVAALPILWLAVSYKAACVHYWFQFRSLFILIFGGLLFILSAFKEDNTLEKR